MKLGRTIASLLLSISAIASFPAHASILIDDDFSEAPFVAGDLAGQQGWAIVGAPPSGVTIASGAATIAAGTTTNLPDVRKSFATISSQDGRSIYYATTISVTQANPLTTSFFLTLRTADGFDNLRLSVQGTGETTFQFGIRPTGEGANTTAFGADLEYGTFYNVIAGYDWLAGPTNDLASLWVNPASAVRSENTPYVTNTNLGSEIVGVTGITFQPFGNATTNPSPGVLFKNTVVTFSDDSIAGFSEAYAAVPEPSTLLLLCGSLAVVALLGHRRLFLQA